MIWWEPRPNDVGQMKLRNCGGASMTAGSFGGGGQGQSSGHHGGRGPEASLDDPSSSPPELSGVLYGGCSDGGSKGGMNRANEVVLVGTYQSLEVTPL